jgi:riboflavin-specific deaminase-like protein
VAHPNATATPAAEDAAWAALLALNAGCAEPDTDAQLMVRRDGSWQPAPGVATSARDLLALYLPLCGPEPDARWIVGHLGQSLDGCIATHTGDSCFVTGPENIVHLHRMRALCDAIVVGAGTVASDDPRLTTRLVPGSDPVRVIVDPRGRLDADYRVFSDGAAPTLLCTAVADRPQRHGNAEILVLPADGDGLALDALTQALATRGLRRIFIEGGGVTVSCFLAAGLLSRLQIAVAPLIIGQGRPGVCLPRKDRLSEALRPAPRIFRMGTDMLYDLDLTVAAAGEGCALSTPTQPCGGVRRVL